MHVYSMFSDRPHKLWNLASLRRLMTNVVLPNNVILLRIFLFYNVLSKNGAGLQFSYDRNV